MEKFQLAFANLFLSLCVFGAAAQIGKSENDLIASMQTVQLPSIDSQDFYAAHAHTTSRFRVARAVKFDEENASKSKSEAISASFGIGLDGIKGSLSAAQADGENTKGFFGAYPNYPPPVGGHFNGGYIPQGSSSSSAAAAASSSGGPKYPVIGGPVSGGFAGDGDGFYPGSGVGGYYPGSGVGGGFGGYYPQHGYGYQPGYGYQSGYGYQPGYGYQHGYGYQPGYPGGYPPQLGGYFPPGPGLYNQVGYGFGGFRKGEDKKAENLDKNLTPDAAVPSSKPSSSSSGNILFKEN